MCDMKRRDMTFFYEYASIKKVTRFTVKKHQVVFAVQGPMYLSHYAETYG